jgi:hypothetical protein
VSVATQSAYRAVREENLTPTFDLSQTIPDADE